MHARLTHVDDVSGRRRRHKSWAKVDPDVTPEEILRRAATYVRLHPTWPLTAMSLAKYWGSLETGYRWTPGGAGDQSARPASISPTSKPPAPGQLSPAGPPSPSNVAERPPRAAPAVQANHVTTDGPSETGDVTTPGRVDWGSPSEDLIFAEVKDTLDEIFSSPSNDA